MNIEVRKQKKLDIVNEKDCSGGELPKKYITKMLYKLDDGKFKEKYLKKFERNWQK